MSSLDERLIAWLKRKSTFRFKGTAKYDWMVQAQEASTIIRELKAERDALLAWQQKAFDAYPNIDLDIEGITR